MAVDPMRLGDAALVDYLKRCPRTGSWNVPLGERVLRVGRADFVAIVKNHATKLYMDVEECIDKRGLVAISLTNSPKFNKDAYDLVVLLDEGAESFKQEATYKGEPVWDHTDVWWTRDGGRIWWAGSREEDGEYYATGPWTIPSGDGLLGGAFEEAIEATGAPAYSLDTEAEERLPEGIVFRSDPQVGVGMVWTLFDPNKELRR